MNKTIIALVTLAGLATLAVFHLWTPSSPTEPPAVESLAAPEPNIGFAWAKTPRPLPDLRFVNSEGDALTLADFRGKTLLLNVWATWCVPCQEEMPALDRLQTTLGGPDFEVVALSVDSRGLGAVKNFYQEQGLEALDIFVDQSGGTPLTLNLLGIPTTLLIDPQGREIGRMLGIAEWDSPEMIALLRRRLEILSAREPLETGKAIIIRLGKLA